MTSLTEFSPEQKTCFVNIHDATLLLVNGPDAIKFLQGQVTCDIRELARGITRIGAQCNPKGRMLLSFRALQINPESVALRIPLAMLESAINTLGKYIVFSKAKLHKGNEKFQLFGLYGPTANQFATKHFDGIPEEDEGFLEKNGNYLIRLDDQRFECWIALENVDIFQQKLEGEMTINDLKAWKLLDIKAGIAEIVPDIFELFTPQELNYQLINGINFRKGCYTGQEIVARLHYRGKLKRHMYRFTCDNNPAVAPGDAVLTSDSFQITGHIISATTLDGVTEILASIQDQHKDNVIIEQNREKLKRLPLPYAIPTADENTD